MTEKVEREIRELHDFFAGWLGGTLDATEETFDRFAVVLAPSFFIVSPAGEVTPRDLLLDAIRKAHGQRPDLEIEVRNVEIHQDEAPWILATYEEWQQEAGGSRTGRISSVLFRHRHGRPHGLEWQHVHETWLEGARIAARTPRRP